MRQERIGWLPTATVEKYRGGPSGDPYERIVRAGNVLTDLGANALWQALTDGGASTVLWEGHLGESDTTPWVGAYLAVGTGTTSATASDTDLASAGTANSFYMTMTNGWPKYTEGDALNTAFGSLTGPGSVDFRATFGTSVANFAWNEWGLGAVGSNPNEDGADGTSVNFTDTGGTFSNRMFSRKVTSFGTKTSSDTWILTVTYTISSI